MDWLTECTDGDVDAMKTMVDLYLTRTSSLIVELNAAAAANQVNEVRRIAHACVGSSGTCGMVAMVPLFKSLEKMGAAGKLENTSEIMARVGVEFERTKKFLAAKALS